MDDKPLKKNCFAILGRVIVVPNTNHRSEEGVGVIKSLENLFFGDSAKNEVEESPAGYYDENGYYQRKSILSHAFPAIMLLLVSQAVPQQVLTHNGHLHPAPPPPPVDILPSVAQFLLRKFLCMFNAAKILQINANPSLCLSPGLCV